MKIEQPGARSDSPVGVVWIDHDRDAEVVEVLEPVRFDNASAYSGKRRCKAAVGWPQCSNRPMRQNVSKRLDERLRAGARDDIRGGSAVPPSGCGLEFRESSAFRQARPRFELKIGQRIGVWIDAGREVDPELRRPFTRRRATSSAPP